MGQREFMNKTKYIAQALALAAVSVLGVGAAKAAMVEYQIGDGGLESFNITYNYGLNLNTTIGGALAGGIAITKVAGGSQPTGFPSTYTTVCTDIGGTVYLGSTYGYDQASFAGQKGIDPNWGLDAYDGKYSAALLSGEQGKAIQNAASIFYNNFTDLRAGTATQKAAVQLAVWAAVYDTDLSGSVEGITYNSSTGNYSFSGGRFQVTSGDQAAINLAASWLKGLTGGSTYTGDLLYPDPTYQGNADGAPVQELLIRTQDAAPVPEPTTMIAGALLLLPFGASTLRVLRRNRTA